MTDASNAVIDVEFEQPACATRHAWARVPPEPTPVCVWRRGDPLSESSTCCW